MPDTNPRFNLLASVRVLAIDLDGVVYSGKTMIAGADAAIASLRTHGLRAVFVTNSSVRTPAEVARKLTGMRIPARKTDVITSAYVAGLLNNRIAARKTLVLGGRALKEEITRAGAAPVTGTPCDSVVVGMDTDFSYDKIRLAMEVIAAGAVFIACNRDPSFPGDDGHMLPGCGPMVAAIESAAGSPPRHVAGKPNILMLQIIADRLCVKPDQILVVGDSMESDIAMAIAFGSPSVLVAPKAQDAVSGARGPSHIIASLAELPGLFQSRLPVRTRMVTIHETH